MTRRRMLSSAVISAAIVVALSLPTALTTSFSTVVSIILVGARLLSRAVIRSLGASSAAVFGVLLGAASLIGLVSIAGRPVVI